MTDSIIRWLQSLQQGDLPEAGGKGANLGEALRASLPVPPGFVVTASTYRAHLATSGLTERIQHRLQGATELPQIEAASAEIRGWIEGAPISPTITKAITEAYTQLAAQLGTTPLAVAVRSSATAEDLPNASFAGQQESFLGVQGASAVLHSVRRCWASLWTAQAIAYRLSMGFDHGSVALAVVVQALIPAEIAGVMFTANPVTGARDQRLISAAWGLGESVVSGAVTPDTFTLAADGRILSKRLGSKALRIRPSGESTITEPVRDPLRTRFCLSDADLRKLADLANRVEAHFGAPQDTEWAMAGGRCYLLQARPITTLPPTLPPPGEALLNKHHPGLVRQMEYVPEPPTPVEAAGMVTGLRAFDRFFGMLGFKPAKGGHRLVERPDGRLAIQAGNPRLSLAMLWRIPAALIDAARRDPAIRWRPVEQAFISSHAHWQERAAQTEDPVVLSEILSAMADEYARLLGDRFGAAMIPGIYYHLKVSRWARKVAGKAGAAALNDRLMRAVPFATARMNQDLATLAFVAQESGQESPAFAAALETFLQTWGSRPSRGMITMGGLPTWREEPEAVLQLVHALLQAGGNLRGQCEFSPAGDCRPESAPTPAEHWQRLEADYKSAAAEVEAKLGRRARAKFRLHLERARTSLHLREEGLYLFEVRAALVRQITLKLGALLVQRGALDRSDDAIWLLHPELVPVARGEMEGRPLVARRRAAHAQLWTAHERGLHWLIATGTIPHVAPKKRRITGGIVGMAASGGVAEGTVCIVRDPSEFHKLQKGQILVAPYTAPVWTPLFRIAAAVVTDVGNPTSHAAIVAREFGIPAVVATENGTALLKDGQLVRVDGTAGTVSLL